MNLRYAATMTNLFTHTNLDIPTTLNIRSGTFGRIQSDSKSDSRWTKNDPDVPPAVVLTFDGAGIKELLVALALFPSSAAVSDCARRSHLDRRARAGADLESGRHALKIPSSTPGIAGDARRRRQRRAADSHLPHPHHMVTGVSPAKHDIHANTPVRSVRQES